MSNLENYMKRQAIFCEQNDSISKNLYSEYGVKRGLRDEKGQGVLTGLTNISDIKAFEYHDGVKSPCDGELSYRGYNIKDLVTGGKGKRFIFEEGAYLLLFGELPTDTQLMEFQGRLSDCMELPTNFTRDVIMKAPTSDIMGSMTRSILTLGSYDKEKESLEIPNVLRQSMQLIAVFPMLAVYAYHAYCHYEKNESMYIHRPEKDLSIAENFLRLLRPDTKFTELEARVLDIALLLHMEHGGGNNSTFTTRVVTSSGSDTYSVISAAMSSLKGKKHGGANLMVMNMMDDIKSHVKDYEDEEEIASYLSKILKKEAFDQKGLIYGIVRYVIMAISGIGVLWYIQVLWIFSMLLLLVRKFERDRIWKKGEKTPVWLLVLLTVCVYGFSQVLNTPVVTVYRFGIYGFCFFTGYFIFSHDEVVERLSKWWGIFLIVAGATGIFYTIYYFGENYAVAPVLNNLPACIYCWFSILAILAFMKKYGNAENKISRWMLKKSWGIYVFHYLPLACVAYYLRSFTSELPEGIVYIVVGISAFAGALLLYEIIRRIPIICWCVLGLKKEKKDV